MHINSMYDNYNVCSNKFSGTYTNLNSCTVYGMLASNDTSGINQYSNIMEYAISTDRKENTENIHDSLA